MKINELKTETLRKLAFKIKACLEGDVSDKAFGLMLELVDAAYSAGRENGLRQAMDVYNKAHA